MCSPCQIYLLLLLQRLEGLLCWEWSSKRKISMKGAEKPGEMRGAEHDGGLCPLAPANAGGMSRTNQAGLPRRDVKRCGSCRNEAGLKFQCVFISNRNENRRESFWHGWPRRAGPQQSQQRERAGKPRASRACSVGQHLLRRPLGYSWSLAKEEVTNPPGFSGTSGTEMPDLGRSSRRELNFAILCKGKRKPKPSRWEGE